MDEVLELNKILSKDFNVALEDSFVKEARMRIKSYEDFKKRLNQNDVSLKRITLYTEDIPSYKYLANVKF